MTTVRDASLSTGYGTFVRLEIVYGIWAETKFPQNNFNDERQHFTQTNGLFFFLLGRRTFSSRLNDVSATIRKWFQSSRVRHIFAWFHKILSFFSLSLSLPASSQTSKQTNTHRENWHSQITAFSCLSLGDGRQAYSMMNRTDTHSLCLYLSLIFKHRCFAYFLVVIFSIY